jgi:NADPH2:quinone reductase
MKAIVIDESRSDRPLVLREVPDPSAGPNDLLVAVRAAALNRADLRRAASHFAASEQRSAAAIAGLELAGEVISTGPNVRGFAIGDRVMAMAGNAYAEKALVDYRLAIPVPTAFNWKQAAATPVTFVTAYDALANAAELQPNEAVFVQGASSGAGIAAVQIGHTLGARPILGTAGDAAKLAKLKELSCDVPINYKTQNFVEIVREETKGSGAQVVIDHVGGATAQGNIDSAAIKGRIVCVGRVSGVEATINLDEFSRKRLHMIGVTFRTRTLGERVQVIRRFCTDMLPKLENGSVRPVIDSVFPLAQAASAQERMRENLHFGKIILEI